MPQTIFQHILTIAAAVLATVLTRAVPFMLWTEGRPLPDVMRYLGKVLPTAILALLVIFSFKDTAFLEGNHGMPELIAGAVTALLHVTFRKMFLSMAGGTACYMILVNFVFAP